MTWTNLTGSDVAYAIVDRYRPSQRVRGPYRLRENAERELRTGANRSGVGGRGPFSA